jgi:hypothetical protein
MCDRELRIVDDTTADDHCRLSRRENRFIGDNPMRQLAKSLATIVAVAFAASNLAFGLAATKSPEKPKSKTAMSKHMTMPKKHTVSHSAKLGKGPTKTEKKAKLSKGPTKTHKAASVGKGPSSKSSVKQKSVGSKSGASGKTHVKGYTTKSGKVVHPYTRKAPEKR